MGLKAEETGAREEGELGRLLFMFLALVAYLANARVRLLSYTKTARQCTPTSTLNSDSYKF